MCCWEFQLALHAGMHVNWNVATTGKGAVMAPVAKGKGKGKPPPEASLGLGSEEDRSRDWYCPQCRQRNFVKRLGCFQCKTPRPADYQTACPPKGPEIGGDLNGFVKSYNRKGFGFIMCVGNEQCQDVYYARENLHPLLQNRDISGEHITFELQRGSDGKLVAHKVRPVGTTMNCMTLGDSNHGKGAGKVGTNNEDRSRDWSCDACGERNFVKRNECFKCKSARKNFDESPPRRTFSPHAGSRAVREALRTNLSKSPARRTFSPRDGSRAVREALAGRRSRSRSAARKKKKKKKKKRSRSRSSDESSSSDDRSKRKKKKARKRSRSSSAANSNITLSSDEGPGAPAQESVQAEVNKLLANGGNGGLKTEMDIAKCEALDKLMKLRTVEPKEVRMTEWRSLLRRWHPDKNPENVEVATAVFQFLQKAKPALDAMV